MTAEEYEIIRRYCTRVLFNGLHNRHLEDLVQFVAMKAFENPRGNWNWYIGDYFRLNGLAVGRSKVSSYALERATLIGEDSYVVDNNQSEEEVSESFVERMDDFVSQLGLEKETQQWIMKIQEKRLSHKLSKKGK